MLLAEVATREGVTTPLIVGGVPRDRVLGNLGNKFNDLDLTNGESTISYLARNFAIELHKKIPIVTKQAEDGHCSIFMKNLKIDFSSNFIVPSIDWILRERGITPTTPLIKETYSRDFTCNTLLMTLDFKQIRDLTGVGMQDIKNKIIRTCLTPDQTFKFNNRRIVRTIYLAAKLGFDVDPAAIEWIRNNLKFNSTVSHDFLAKNINKALDYDADRTVFFLNKMDLWKTIPMTSKLYPYYKQRIAGELHHV